MPWLALSFAVDAEEADVMGDALLGAGAHSVTVDDPQSPTCRVTALLAEAADARAVLASAARDCGVAAPARFVVERVEDEDWVRRTQAQFKPIAIGDRLWVGPGWHEPPAGTRAAVVRIDPGLAFGTGSHPSTRLMLEYLAGRISGNERVLDYGCGSGILAVAAARLGAAAVDAVDIDPQSVEATTANAARNAVRVRAALPDALPAGDYDVVVANILAQPLILLAPLLAARVAPQGTIALAGLLEAQADEVRTAYEPYFHTRRALAQEGWSLVEGTKR
ncbi:MAG TPA: 50S ribosomal protein L11 methyltransferase [Burkholderiales bacterium]|nr:50S ribosomal protein L11 methyltransferase [Burkholderiales bacterium]